MIMNFFRMLKDRPKNVGIIGVQRLPTAHLLPIVARTEIRHFRLKGNFGQNTSLLVAEEGPRPIEQLGHIVARP
jgi:hypothetical protein